MTQEPPAARLSSTLVRSALLVFILFVALTGAALVVRTWILRDGDPDDRLLATMQQVTSDAQTILDETGELPNSLDSLLTLLDGDRLEDEGSAFPIIASGRPAFASAEFSASGPPAKPLRDPSLIWLLG